MNHNAVRLTLKVLERIAQKIERNGSLDNPKHVEHLYVQHDSEAVMAGR